MIQWTRRLTHSPFITWKTNKTIRMRKTNLNFNKHTLKQASATTMWGGNKARRYDRTRESFHYFPRRPRPCTTTTSPVAMTIVSEQHTPHKLTSRDCLSQGCLLDQRVPIIIHKLNTKIACHSYLSTSSVQEQHWESSPSCSRNTLRRHSSGSCTHAHRVMHLVHERHSAMP